MWDPVTERLYSFLDNNGKRLVADARERSLGLGPELFLTPDGQNQQTAAMIEDCLGSISTEIKALCLRNEFGPFLVLFRKLTHQLAFQLLRSMCGSSQDLVELFSPVFSDAVLFGTNYMLGFCPRGTTLQRMSDRYRIDVTDAQMNDVVRVFLLSIVHRYGLFCMNSIARETLVQSGSINKLLDIYNARVAKSSKRTWRPAATDMSNAVIYPVSVRTVARVGSDWRARDRDGTDHILQVRNYLPVAFDADVELRRFPFLDTDDFEKAFRIPFGVFRRVWLGLNLLLVHTFPILWPKTWIRAAEPSLLSARLEQNDDYCETALGGGVPDSIWRSCHDLVGERDGARLTLEDCRAVVAFLTFRQIDSDIRFTEQPFVFYPAGDSLLLWDYARHGGLLRCLARNLSRTQSPALKKQKGDTFEQGIITKISQIPGVTGVQRWVYKKGGALVWEIDVGFVYRNILFIIEAKNEQKSVRYFFDAVEVAAKTQRRESLLAKLDEKLRAGAGPVRAGWAKWEPIVGAICLICTAEAEFVSSTEPEFWLDRYLCPRVCMIEELVAFLKQPRMLETVLTHTAFVRF